MQRLKSYEQQSELLTYFQIEAPHLTIPFASACLINVAFPEVVAGSPQSCPDSPEPLQQRDLPPPETSRHGEPEWVDNK